MQNTIDTMQNTIDNLQNAMNNIANANFQCGTSKVADYDGNLYNTVRIGTQCWTKENLKTTHLNDGTEIPTWTYTTSNDLPSSIMKCYPGRNINNVPTNGYLYNWHAATNGGASNGQTNIQGLCPTGWHVPSSSEWIQLRVYSENNPNESSCPGKALASETGWNSHTGSCSVGNPQYGSNNSTNFSALPAGCENNSSGSSLGLRACFWSADESAGTSSISALAYYFMLEYDDITLTQNSIHKDIGASIRCLRDIAETANEGNEGSGSSACCTNLQSQIDDLADVAFTGDYNDLDNKPVQVKSDWTEYDTSSVAYIKNKPTVLSYNDVQNMINSSLGALNNRIDSLQNALNAAQQAEQQNNNLTFVCGTSKVTDYDGNQYNTVKIGNQCWIKENIRTTHFADGTAIDPVFGSGYDHRDGNAPAFTSYNTLDQTIDYIYNMAAAFHGLPSQVCNINYGQTGGPEEEDQYIQGICPDGWHLPSDNDWTILTSTLSDNGMYCGQNSSYIAKALASDNTNSWASSTVTCAIGNNISANNASGFSAVGNLLAYFHLNSDESYTSGGQLAQYGAHFWTSTPQIRWGVSQIPYAIDTVSCFELDAFTPTVTSNVYYNKEYLMAVRCTRDEADGTVQQMQQIIEELQQQVSQQSQLPNVYINSISSDGATKAKVTATAYASNGEVILARGICWSRLENPTVNGYNCFYTLVDTNTSIFQAFATSLTAGDTYYVRAFATTANGTAYSTQQTYTHIVTIPYSGSETITLYSGQEIWIYDNGGPSGNYTNNCNGSLTINTNSNSYQVMIDTIIYTTESGYDYLYVYNGTAANDTFLLETLNGTGTAAGIYPNNGTRALTLKFTSDGSQVYSGFAIKMKVVSMCPSTVYKSVYYNTVRMGEQCWMKENLRYSTGTLSSGSDPSIYVSESVAYRYYPNNNSSNLSTYGYLYNFAAIRNGVVASSGMQGICPSGWHIPTYTDLTVLRDKGADLTDPYGFSMNYPGRLYASNANTGSFLNFGETGFIWGINESGQALTLQVSDNIKSGFVTIGAGKMHGFSLRCIKNQ